MLTLLDPPPLPRSHESFNQAACADPDVLPDIFYDRQHRDLARRTCGSCPAVDACLELALLLHSATPIDGVWAGTTPIERDRLLAKRKQTSLNTAA